jgi:iron-sulfur cluster repair protein YtfE (RIC family)
VREIAIEHPASVRILESLGIDYCCGGKRTLDEGCRRANVPLSEVLHALSAAGERPTAEGADCMLGHDLFEQVAQPRRFAVGRLIWS